MHRIDADMGSRSLVTGNESAMHGFTARVTHLKSIRSGMTSPFEIYYYSSVDILNNMVMKVA